MMRNLSLLLIILFSLVSAGEYRLPRAQRYTVTVAAHLTIVGSYYPSPSENAQLVVLLHMLGRNRGDWNECARFLQKEGYAVVSLDLPGHGESTNGLSVLWPKFSNQDYLLSLTQLEEVMRDMQQRLGIPAKETAVLGMGYGASLALYLQSKGYSAVAVLIEPIQVVHGIDLTTYLQSNDRPLYVIVGNDDTTAQKIKARAANCTIDVYSRSLNPLRWFFGNTIQYDHIVSWLKKSMQG